MKVLRDLFTDSQDNWELASILGLIVIGAFIYLAYNAYVVQHQPFDPQGFGLGAGALAGGIGAHKLLSNKADTQ